MKITNLLILCCLFLALGLEFTSCKSLEASLTEKKKKKATPSTNTQITNQLQSQPQPQQKVQEKKELINAYIRKGSEATVSVAYNYEKNQEKDVATISGGIKPKIVDRLPSKNDSRYENKNEKVSPIFVGDEKSNTDYYDGMNKIKAFKEDCEKIGANKEECLNHSHCGFCEDENQNICIPGDKSGPMRNCKNFRYFNSPKQQ